MGGTHPQSDTASARRLPRSLESVVHSRTIAAVVELAPRLVFPTVLVLAGVLRLLSLSSVPPALADEVFAAVDLHSVLSQGRHFTGAEASLLAHITPVVDGRSLAAVFLGTSVSDLRVVAVFFGIGAVALMAKLGDELEDRRLGLLGALFLAIMPWHIYFSRIYLPASEIVCLTLFSLVLCLVALRKGSLLYAAGAVMTGAVSIYLYPVSLLITPLLLLSIVLLRWESARTFGLGRTIVVALLGLLLLIPYLIGRLSGNDATVNAINTSILNRMIWAHGLSPGEVLLRVLGNWFSYVTPRFLFFSGDPNVRQSIQTLGEVGWGIGALGMIGIGSALWRRSRADLLVMSWFLLYPIGSSLTFFDAPGNGVRAVMGSVVWALLAAMGLCALLALRSWMVRSALIMGAAFAVIAQVIAFSTSYFGPYSHERAYAFETGYTGIYQVLRERGVQDVPITLHAGYQRDAMLEYFSGYRLRVSELVQACYELPFAVVHYTVLPKVFIVREDRDYWLEPGCVHEDLIRSDIRALKRTGASVEVLKIYPNAQATQFETAILFVERSTRKGTT